MKKLALITLALALLTSMGLWANGGSDSSESEEVTLTWAFLESNPAIIEVVENIMADYEAANPGVTVKIETFRDTPSYNQAMQIRLAAGELPDIMFLKSNEHIEYKDSMVELTNEDYFKANKFADIYKLDGKGYFVPAIFFTEQVFYRQSIIDELGLEIPTTWPEYVDFLKAIKADGRYIPWALGARDAWTNYPLAEFGAQLISGDPNYLNSLTEEKKPFGPGSPFYENFEKMQELAEAGVFGDDPLGIGWSEAAAAFEAGEAATINAGLWAGFAGKDDVGMFPLPLRDSASEELRVYYLVDHFYGVTKNASNVDAAKDLMAYFFSVDTNSRYATEAGMGAATEGAVADLPALAAYEADYDFEPYSEVPLTAASIEKRNAVQFDAQRYGQEITAGLLTVDALADNLNAAWAATF